MAGEREAGASSDGLNGCLQLIAGEGGELAALLANEVMVVGSRVHALIAGGVAADVDPLDQLQLLELVQSAVDAGAADRVDATVDLQRGERALRFGQ